MFNINSQNKIPLDQNVQYVFMYICMCCVDVLLSSLIMDQLEKTTSDIRFSRSHEDGLNTSFSTFLDVAEHTK